ncbi:MAG: ATP-binding protein [Nitrospirota bacterium]
MKDISLHILDIAENSVAAGATLVKIRIIEDIEKDLLSLEIEDNGKGIPEELIGKVLDPFHTTRTTRKVGFGLSLLAQSAREAGGDISIKSKQGEGTVVSARFIHSHIDRKPLGNIADTFLVLIAGNPLVDFIFNYIKNNNRYELDTRQIKSELEGIPINSPPVISAIREDLRECLNNNPSVA